MRAVFSAIFLVLLGCTTDEFATDSGDSGGGDAIRPDAASDSAAKPDAPFACSAGSWLLCDTFERTSDVRGTWTALDTSGGATLELVPGWDGRALRASAPGAMSGWLRFDAPQVSSYELGVDVDVVAAAGPGERSSVIAIASPSETVLFDVDGKTAALHLTGSVEDTIALGSYSGRHRVEIRRDLGSMRIHVAIDGTSVADVARAIMTPGPLGLRVGVIAAPPSSVPTEVRFDDLLLVP